MKVSKELKASTVARPYGGRLIDMILDEREAERRVAIPAAIDVEADGPTLIHLANIATGCYSPLTGFMTESEYGSVVTASKLPSGLDWTIPVLFHLAAPQREQLRTASVVALRDREGRLVGIIEVESVFAVDTKIHCERVFRTVDAQHPGVRSVMGTPPVCVGGRSYAVASRLQQGRRLAPPREHRRALQETGQRTFAAFSTRNICHLGHEHQHRIALDRTDVLGINVIDGAQVRGSFAPGFVLDTYEYLIDAHYPPGRVLLNTLRLPPIYAGPREAFLQATVLQNLGYTHFIVGRDHAGIGGYYGRYASQEIFDELTDLDIEIMPLPEPRYCRVCEAITTEKACRHGGDDVQPFNGRDVRQLLVDGLYGELDGVLRGDLCEFIIGVQDTACDGARSPAATKDELPRRIIFE